MSRSSSDEFDGSVESAVLPPILFQLMKNCACSLPEGFSVTIVRL